MNRIAVTLLFVFMSTALYAQRTAPVEVKSGFLTGNTFLDLSREAKRGYAMGFLDGVFVAPLFGAPKAELYRIEQCAVGMTDEQVVAILNKFLSDNPGRWHEPMDFLSYAALRSACGT